MLLLPISRGTLYVAQSAAALGDVWILLMLPLVGSIPLGLAAGGAPGAALFALAAGVVLVLTVIGISSTTTSLLHLAVRDRRRGELLALLFLLLIPLVSMLPNLLAAESRTRGANSRDAAHYGTLPVPGWLSASARAALSFYPTELYTRATQAAARRDVVPAVRSLGALAAGAILLHLVGIYVFGRVLESPGSTGSRRQVQTHAAWERKLPWLSPGGSAVALAQLRLALRTPRAGRSCWRRSRLSLASPC